MKNIILFWFKNVNLPLCLTFVTSIYSKKNTEKTKHVAKKAGTDSEVQSLFTRTKIQVSMPNLEKLRQSRELHQNGGRRFNKEGEE